MPPTPVRATKSALVSSLSAGPLSCSSHFMKQCIVGRTGARVELRLFPGYVFVRIALRDRLRVLEIPSVVRLMGFNGLPTALPDDEMAALRNGLARRLRAEPHPYLKIGRRVRIIRGPLQGCEGILVRKKGNLRVVLSLELIQRSIVVDVDTADVTTLSGPERI